MYRIFKTLALTAVIMTALLIARLPVSAASFEVEKPLIDATAGDVVNVRVKGGKNLKASSECPSVASAVYDADKSAVTITVRDFGQTKVAVYSADDPKDYSIIVIRSAAPVGEGVFVNLSKYYMRFKFSDGGYAKGWYEINGDTYYFYPNGLAELYTGPIMYKNKMYFLEGGKYTGEVFDAYIFEILNNNMPVPKSCSEFYEQAAERYGSENVKLERTSDGVAVTVQSYMPGFPWGAKGTYYFSGKLAADKKYTENLYKFKFANKVTYHLGGSSDTIYKSTMKSLYVRKALFDAFGKNCKAYRNKNGTITYRWTNVAKEKVTVDLVIGDNSLDFVIYNP